ncbi:MAG TPA: copper resistance protein NlpE [Thermomonas sp.]|nr:copper resistance protein NlpE [Thermomonas sp.]
MHARALAFAIAALAALAGCKPTEPAPAPAAAPADATPAAPAPSAVVAEVDHGSPAGDNTAFDVKAFAGTYAGTIPCADCPGIDMSLAFTPEGRYQQTLRYQERDTSSASDGTWTLDADGRRIHLDPTDKGAQDSWVEIVSPTELRLLDAEGKPIDSTLDYGLRRR